MDFVLVMIALNIHMIFIFKREWLFDKKIFMYILWANTCLLVLSYILLNVGLSDSNFVRALKMPLLAQLIFRGMNIIYLKLYKKNPRSSLLWSGDLKLIKDGVFNFLFWIIGFVIPFFFVFQYKVL
jgi:hypothetical protein